MNELIKTSKTSDCRLIIDKNNSYCAYLQLDTEESYHFLNKYYLKNDKEIKLFINRNEPMICKMWHNSLFINKSGDITPCLNLYDKNFIFGNIYWDNILDVWNSPDSISKVQNLYDNMKKSICYDCEYGKYRQICPANNYYETGELINPSHYECTYCKTKSRVINDLIKEGNL